MAELIPLGYRVRAARSHLIRRWIVFTVAAALLGGGGVTYALIWQARQGAELQRLTADFQAKKPLIQRAEKLRADRQDLALRMTKIQQLRDDKTLLLLLRNISDSFVPASDCLEFISIDAHGRVADHKSEDPDMFVVRLDGFTANTGSLAELMTRLKKKTAPAMKVIPESSRRQPLLDGQVMRFQIICQKPEVAGTDLEANAKSGK